MHVFLVVVGVAYRRQLIDWLKQIREHLSLFVLFTFFLGFGVSNRLSLL